MSRVFVKNLPRLATEEDLLEHFANCGTVTDAVIAKNDENQSREIGYVGFAESGAAEKALLTRNGTYLRGRKIIVERAVSHKVAEQNELKPLKKTMSRGAKALYEQIINDGDDLLKQYLNQHKGWKDDVIAPPVKQKSVKQSEDEQKDRDVPPEMGEIDEEKVKLINVPELASEEQIREHFQAFGEIQSITIATNVISKKPTGVVYVTFAVPEAAKRAIVAEETLFLGRFVKMVQARASAIAEFIKKKEYNAKGFDKNNRLAWNPLVERQQNIVAALEPQLGDNAGAVEQSAVAMAAAEAFIQQEIRQAFEQNGICYDQNEDVPRSTEAVLCKNVPAEIQESDLKALFEQFGIVVSCLRVYLGFFLVKMAQPSDCKRAFNKLAFRKLGKEKVPLMLEFARLKEVVPNAAQKQDQAENAELQQNVTLYVKNVSFATETKQIESIVAGLLPESHNLTIPQNDISHKGYFFVSVPESAESAALQALSSTLQDGFRWEASRSREQLDIQFSTKIVVKNLAFEANPQELRDLLSQFGRLAFLRCPKKLDGGLRGFAFAEFATAREAQAAYEGIQGVHFYGRRLVCEVGKEESAEQE